MTNTRAIVDAIKLEMGCAHCGFNADSVVLEFDHIDPANKYRTRKGRLVRLSDMVHDRYSLATILSEISKCRILCANCHAIHTYRTQRGI